MTDQGDKLTALPTHGSRPSLSPRTRSGSIPASRYDSFQGGTSTPGRGGQDSISDGDVTPSHHVSFDRDSDPARATPTGVAKWKTGMPFSLSLGPVLHDRTLKWLTSKQLFIASVVTLRQTRCSRHSAILALAHLPNPRSPAVARTHEQMRRLFNVCSPRLASRFEERHALGRPTDQLRLGTLSFQ